MTQYYNQKFETPQPQLLYFHGGVRLYTNECKMPYIEADEEKYYYLYDIEEYSQIEYTEKLTSELSVSKNEIETLTTENKQLWDTVEYILKQTGDIPPQTP